MLKKYLYTTIMILLFNSFGEVTAVAHNRAVVIPLGTEARLEPYAPIADTHPASSSYFTNAINPNVLDYITGLTWQKEDDNTFKTFIQAQDYCRDLTIGGEAWRLPSVHELMSIVHYGHPDSDGDPDPALPVISQVFIGTEINIYWTATTTTTFGESSYYVSFWTGSVGVANHPGSGYVRCVSRSTGQPGNYKDKGSVVEDLATGLIWQEQDDNIAYSLTGAVAYCQGLVLGGKQDWRVPTIKELYSIADHRLGDAPTIDRGIFQGTDFPYSYWSSTLDEIGSGYAFWLTFGRSASVSSVDTSVSTAYVRCVR